MGGLTARRKPPKGGVLPYAARLAWDLHTQKKSKKNILALDKS